MNTASVTRAYGRTARLVVPRSVFATDQLPIAAIMCLAAALAFFDLAGKSFWLDEVLSVNAASMSWSDLADFWWRSEANMGLYYAALKVWISVFGTGEAAVRSLSALPAVASLWVTWRVGSKLFSNGAGIAAALVLALNATFISFAQEARAYSFVILFAMLATLAFLRALERPTFANWVLYVLLVTVTIYFHVFAVLLVPAHFLPALALQWKRLRWLPITASGAIGSVLVIPVIAFIPRMDPGNASWIPARDFSDVPLFFDFLTSFNRWLLATYGLAGLLGLIWVGRTARGAGFTGRLWGIFLAASVLFLPLVIATLFSMTVRPMLVSRYLLYSLPALALLVGLGVGEARPWIAGIALATLIAVLSAAGLRDYYAAEKEDWRAAARLVAASATRDDAVVLHAGFIEAPFSFYMGRQPGNVAPLDQFRVRPGPDGGIEDGFVENVMSTYQTVWLVLAHGSSSLTSEIRQALAQGYGKVEEQGFAEVRVVRYSERTYVPEAKDEILFDDGLRWKNWSWGTRLELVSGGPVFEGQASLSVAFQRAWAAVSFGADRFDTTPYKQFRFAVHSGGELPVLRVAIYGENPEEAIGESDIARYASNTGNGWWLVAVPLADLNAADRNITRIHIQENSGSIPPEFNLDSVGFFMASVVPEPAAP